MIQIYINDVDKSAEIENESIALRQTLTKAPGTLNFSIKNVDGRTMPSLGDTVVLKEDSSNIFKGIITERSEAIIKGLLVGFDFVCKDGIQVFDRRLVAKAYQGVQAHEVVEDIVDSFTTGFTFTPPASSPAIDSIRFNYEQPSKALQLLCQAIAWDWYIDENYAVQFFAKGTRSAPFSITDSNQKIAWESLEFDRNILELKNSVFIRGGTFLDSIAEGDARDVEVADGEKVQFLQGLQYSDIEVTVDGTPKTVGIDFIDDPADYDCLYNFQEKYVKFRDDNKPADGDVVKVFGDAHIPLIVQAEDPVSIASYGRYEGIHIDKTINSIPEAEILAGALLEQWRSGSYAGKFRTLEKGLRVGQSITINSTSRGINDSFIINYILGKMKGNDRLEYSCQFIKSGDVNFTDIMVMLLGKDRRDLVIADNEVIQRITSLSDSLGVSDEIVSLTKNSPPYTYEGGINDGEWNLATWS